MDQRAKLFPALADTSFPFSMHWKDIFRRLPVVKTEMESCQPLGQLKLAFLQPQNEIHQIETAIIRKNSLKIDSDCFLLALDKWVDGDGNFATLDHLWQILEVIRLGGAAKRFFEQHQLFL